ncbi:hypothetical protein [Rhodoferax koreensis]|uniref:hypothetical protein n=1 Tax=Rhodoferax koreensis TaxID=1842727 RepID=UPI0012FFCD38|nr:hypothetical protein [Rhodoferax koreense]
MSVNNEELGAALRLALDLCLEIRPEPRYKMVHVDHPSFLDPFTEHYDLGKHEVIRNDGNIYRATVTAVTKAASHMRPAKGQGGGAP